MRTLWTLFKVCIVLAIAIPIGLFALSLVLGAVGIVMGLLFLALRVAIVGVVGYGIYRLGRHLLGADPKPAAHAAPVVRDLPPVDPYYQAAMRELDTELGHTDRP